MSSSTWQRLPLICPHSSHILKWVKPQSGEEQWVSSVDYWIWIISADKITH